MASAVSTILVYNCGVLIGDRADEGGRLFVVPASEDNGLWGIVARELPQRQLLEQSFTILAQSELRARYDALLVDPESPVIFPYVGFRSLLGSAEQSRDG